LGKEERGWRCWEWCAYSCGGIDVYHKVILVRRKSDDREDSDPYLHGCDYVATRTETLLLEDPLQAKDDVPLTVGQQSYMAREGKECKI
jgi:hypothetical protein